MVLAAKDLRSKRGWWVPESRGSARTLGQPGVLGNFLVVCTLSVDGLKVVRESIVSRDLAGGSPGLGAR